MEDNSKSQIATNNKEQFIINKMFFKGILIALALVELVALPVWFFAAVMSIPGSGAEWKYWLSFGPFWAYPLFVIIAFGESYSRFKETELLKSLLSLLLIPAISLSWPFLTYLVFQ